MRRARASSRGISLLLILFLAGCITTQDRFSRGFEAEQEGDPYRAARAYAEVLRRDPGFRDVRERFERTAREAAPFLYTAARAAEQSEHYSVAVERLDDLSDLHRLAADFGVMLDLPADYEAFYDTMSEAAVRNLLAAAEHDAARRFYADADQRYERALTYRMPEALRAELDRRRTDNTLAWAQHALGSGAYRQAHDLAGRLLALSPRPEAAMLRAAERVQLEALDAGSEVVAFLPVLSAERASDAPSYWPGALSTLLSDRFWSAPPLFVVPVPPLELRRELGRMGRRAPFTRSEAVGIARAVGADLVLVPELYTYTRAERDRRETSRTIATRGGRDTTYADVRFTLVLEAELRFRLYETTTRNVMGEGRVPARVSRDVRFATYAGDRSALRFPSGSVEALFGRDARERPEAEAEAELQEELAEQLAEAVFQKILEIVP